jgi:hypothetical protein
VGIVQTIREGLDKLGQVRRIGLECRAGAAYSFRMDDTANPLDAPSGWVEALDESLAELAAGVPTIPYADIRCDLLDSIAQMEAKRGAMPGRKATPRR